MREIIFRGMSEDRTGFYYGDLYHHYDGCLQIIPKGECAKFVLQETIEQYTGLKDKNGVMIFEGDYFIHKGEKVVVKYQKVNGRFIALGGKFKILAHKFKLFEIADNIHEVKDESKN